MAFQYLGEITGGLAPVTNRSVGATSYSGQLMIFDYTVGGEVIPSAVAAAGPDVTQKIAGICLGKGRNTSPGGTSIYNSTYKGDTITYSTAQATYLTNSPVGPALAQIQTLTPNSLIKAPLCHDTIGTAVERKACTTTVTNGLTIVTATVDTTVDHFSTVYCASGANRGEYRTVTTAGTTTQTFTVPFTNTSTIGDIFVIVNVSRGMAHLNWDTQFQGIDSAYVLTNYFVAYVHELNLEVAGQEYAVFTLAPYHFA
jgi:hypothetical protein